MTLKEAFDTFRTDLRELKAAAQAHNVGSYEPPPSVPGNTSSTTGKPSSSSPETLPSSGAPATKPEPTVAYIPPPPPPKNLPHGWTARYDEKESKFCYSHGVDSKKEQWEFRMEPLTWEQPGDVMRLLADRTATEELTQEPITKSAA